MKMHKKYFVCCDKCFEALGKENTMCASLWLTVCALRMKFGHVIPIIAEDFPELTTLEAMRYVITHEIGDKLFLKVKGHNIDDNGQNFFCIDEAHCE